jgi:hypothetical protein
MLCERWFKAASSTSFSVWHAMQHNNASEEL